MQAFYEVMPCNNFSGAKQIGGVVRNYYIAVEKVLWDYAPSGKDLITNISLTEADRWAVFKSSTVLIYSRNTAKVNH